MAGGVGMLAPTARQRAPPTDTFQFRETRQVATTKLALLRLRHDPKGH